MTGDFLSALIGANLATAAAILVIAVLRRPVRRLAGARVAYALWAIAPMACVASLLPPLELTHPILAPTPIRPLAEAAVVVIGAALERASPVKDPAMSIMVVWAAGAVIALGILLWRQAQTLRLLGRLVPERPGLVRAARKSVGPAVVGLLTSKIVLPADFETPFDAHEQALIHSHQRAHLAAG
jgi:beta-lactamase regulating signal transducer with metallopeptidase domain